MEAPPHVPLHRRSRPLPILVIVIATLLVCPCGMMAMMVGSTAIGALLESRPGADLVDAASKGDRARVERALREGADPNYRLIEIETTPLEASLGNAHYDVALLLVRSGARVREELHSGKIPLPPPEVVRTLTEAEDRFRESHQPRD